MDRFHQETFGKAPPEPSEAETQVVAPRLGIGSLESGPAIATATMAAGADAAPPAAVLEREITGFEVVFAKSNRSVRCTSQDCILEVAEENGIELNSSCRSGNCGTCKLKKLEGTVLMEGQTALSADEIEAGHVVICIGRPGSRVVLDA
jgi:ferredoxin